MPSFSFDSLDQVHKDIFAKGIAVLDVNYAPPLLWGSPKLSSWYAVGLLARNETGDKELAAKLLHNSLTQQDLDKDFIQNYGSFKDHIENPLSSGPDPIWVSDIYDSYDPNNALFVTVPGIMVDALFSHLIPDELMERLRSAMVTAVRGNLPRKQEWFGDDLSPEYSNPYFMRAVCTSYIGNMIQDKELLDIADEWVREATALWEKYDSPGEFNSPTYAGITLLALGLAQYCPEDSEIAKTAPKLIESTWVSLGETYNPSLLNIAGPWDRGYGYCMTRYYACIASAIAAVLGDDESKYPMPSSLASASHHTDVACIPMQMILSDYVEKYLPDATLKRLTKLEPHSYSPKSTFAPFDKTPRDYSFHILDGLNVGGIKYDETQLGGPKGVLYQYIPGVIQWDSGKHGNGVGWIAVWPTAKCASIVATADSLSISLPKSVDGTENDCKKIQLHIGCLPFFQLTHADFQKDTQELPGLTLKFSGNAAKAPRRLSFSKSTTLHGAKYYQLVIDLTDVDSDVPELVIGLEKTKPPSNDLVF